MTFDWWTLALQTINVIVLIWLLSRFLFRPVREIIEQRQTAARDLLEAAETARRDASEAKEAVRAQQSAVAEGRAEILEEAREEAEAERARMMAEARDEVERLKAQAEAESRDAFAAEARRLETGAAELATDIAERVLSRLPDSVMIAGFIDGLIEAAASLPEAALAEIAAETPLKLRAARELSQEEEAELRKRLGSLLGHEPELVIDSDPTLLAGLELATPHGFVRNHLRADLERIHAELVDHD